MNGFPKRKIREAPALVLHERVEPSVLTVREKEVYRYLEKQGVFDYVAGERESLHVEKLLDRGRFGRFFEQKMKKARTLLKREGTLESAPEALDSFTREMAKLASTILAKVPDDDFGTSVRKYVGPLIVRPTEQTESWIQTNRRIQHLGNALFQGKQLGGEAWRSTYKELSELQAEILDIFLKRTALSNQLDPLLEMLEDFHDERDMVIRQEKAIETVQKFLTAIPTEEKLSSMAYRKVLNSATPKIPDVIYYALGRTVYSEKERFINASERKQLIKKCEDIIARCEEMVRAHDDAIAETEEAIRKR